KWCDKTAAGDGSVLALDGRRPHENQEETSADGTICLAICIERLVWKLTLNRGKDLQSRLFRWQCPCPEHVVTAGFAIKSASHPALVGSLPCLIIIQCGRYSLRVCGRPRNCIIDQFSCHFGVSLHSFLQPT